MVELTTVVFAFNQGEYEADVPTSNESQKIAFCLPDVEDVIVEIVLNESCGVKTIKTHDVGEAETRFKEIWKAKKVEGHRVFCPGTPQYHAYEIRLKDGSILPVELKREAYGGSPYWEHPYTKQRFQSKDVVGWRIAQG